MSDKRQILEMIKQKVHEAEPGATVILYGSYARGEEREDSDIDILVLLDRESEKVTRTDRTKVMYPLSSVGLQTDTLICPVVYTKKGWANHRVSPYYESVNREGIVL